MFSLLFVINHERSDLAVPTQTMELQQMACHRKPGVFRNPLVEGVVDRLIEVEHLSAFCASEMVVRVISVFESARDAAEVQFRNLAILHQRSQIAIHRALADVRDELPHLVVHLIGTGMRIAAPQHTEDSFSLTGIS
jgi:hypothetical protein